jgi:hypothetical protein
MIKNLLIGIGILAAVFLLLPYLPIGSRNEAGPLDIAAPRAPFPCESDHSIECTWAQYQQIAEEDCAKDHAQGRQCEIVTNGQPPHAVRIPSDSELAEMGRKFDDATRRLCGDLANAGYGCHVSHD